MTMKCTDECWLDHSLCAKLNAKSPKYTTMPLNVLFTASTSKHFCSIHSKRSMKFRDINSEFHFIYFQMLRFSIHLFTAIVQFWPVCKCTNQLFAQWTKHINNRHTSWTMQKTIEKSRRAKIDCLHMFGVYIVVELWTVFSFTHIDISNSFKMCFVPLEL